MHQVCPLQAQEPASMEEETIKFQSLVHPSFRVSQAQSKEKVSHAVQVFLIWHISTKMMGTILSCNLLGNKYQKKGGMRATNVMIKRTGMELCILRTGDTMKVNGKMTKCTVLVNFIMRMEKLHMRDTGIMTSSMDREESTIQSLHH